MVHSPAAGSGAWRTGATTIAVLFALAAPWSIAATQTALVAGAVLLVVGLATGRIRVPGLPWALGFVVLFLVVQATSIPLGVHPARSLSCYKGSWSLLFPFVLFGLLAAVPRPRTIVAVFAGSAALAGAYGVVQHFVGMDWLHGRALEEYPAGGFLAVGNLSSHLTYAGVLLPAFFVALGLAASAAADRGGRRAGAEWALAAAAIAGGLIFSYTRTAWIGLAAGILVLGALRGRRAFALTAGGALVLAAAAAITQPALVERALTVLAIAEDPRVRLWHTALRILADHPWIGAGLGSYKTQFFIYQVPGDYMSTVHPHSDILNVAVETGLIGTAVWIGIWVAFFRDTRLPSALGTRATGSRWMLDASRVAVAALLVAGLGQCYSTDEEVAHVWWLVAMFGVHEARRLRPERVAAPGSASRRTLWRRTQRGFKDGTLPLASRLLSGGSRRIDAGCEMPERIVVVRQDNRLGNLLLLTPMLQRLRESAPHAEIGFLAGEAYAPLLAGWPWVDRRIVQPKRRHARFPWLFVPWASSVRRGGWGLALEASNPDTHSYYNCLMALLSGAPVRVGFDHPRSRAALSVAVPAPPADLHFSLAPLRLLRALGREAPVAPMRCPLHTPPSEPFERWRRETGAHGALVVHLGGRDAKSWPDEGWKGTLPALSELYAGPILVVAGPDERHRLEAIAGVRAGRFPVVPPLGITDLAHLLHDAGAFVGCDSGVMHLAVALETPTVALFFRSHPYRYAPLGETHRTVLLADPYGVAEEQWGRPIEGMRRSRLLRAESTGADRLAGVPETGPRAQAAIVRAVAEITGAEASHAHTRGSRP